MHAIPPPPSPSLPIPPHPSPSLTLTHTQIYMYCVWHGWIIQLFLFLAILKLSLNYLHTRYSSRPVCS